MDILIKPLVTEKIAAGNESGKFGFIVDKRANKLQIRSAIEETYGVTVLTVNTMIYLGKPKSRYTKSKAVSGRTPSFKKAVVQLKDGEIIDFYSGI